MMNTKHPMRKEVAYSLVFIDESPRVPSGREVEQIREREFKCNQEVTRKTEKQLRDPVKLKMNNNNNTITEHLRRKLKKKKRERGVCLVILLDPTPLLKNTTRIQQELCSRRRHASSKYLGERELSNKHKEIRYACTKQTLFLRLIGGRFFRPPIMIHGITYQLYRKILQAVTIHDLRQNLVYTQAKVEMILSTCRG